MSYVCGMEARMEGPVTIANHLTLEDIVLRMQMTTGALKLQKLLAIYNAMVDPRPPREIAMHTGLSEATVLKTIADYNAAGPRTVDGVSICFEDPLSEPISRSLS